MASEWISGYRQASFRGVEFFIKSHSYKSGKRLGLHTYPDVDEIGQEDLGSKKVDVTLDAYIVDGDYFSKRDALERALDKDGPGQLIHPYKGSMSVRVVDWSSSESTQEGRVVRFDISMIKATTEPLTTVSINTAADIAETKRVAISAMVAEFVATYTPENYPASALRNVVAALDEGIAIIEAAKKILAPVAEFQRLVSTVKGRLVQISLEAEDLANDIQSLVDFGNDPLDQDNPPLNPREQFDEMVDLFNTRSYVPNGATEDTLGIPGNPLPIVMDQFTRYAVTSAAGIVSEIDFTTVEEAIDARDTLFRALDVIASDPASSDDTLGAVQDVRRSVMSDLDRRILDLTNQVTIILHEATPSLVIAHRVDGDVDNEEEILVRNGVIHPGFVSPAEPVKVVYRG